MLSAREVKPVGEWHTAAIDRVVLSADDRHRRRLVLTAEGGTAWNQITGQISAPRGNISLIGLAVNQDGRLSATTSVSAILNTAKLPLRPSSCGSGTK